MDLIADACVFLICQWQLRRHHFFEWSSCTHDLCLYPGPRQVNKAKKEGRTWEWVTAREDFRALTWREREEG